MDDFFDFPLDYAQTALSDTYGEPDSMDAEGPFYTVFTMFDRLYRSRFLTSGQDAAHQWHMTGRDAMVYTDRNGQKFHGMYGCVDSMNHAAGTMSFGPYEKLSGGKYQAVFEMAGVGGADQLLGHIDLCLDIGKRVITSRPLYGRDFSGNGLTRFTLDVHSRQSLMNLEARVFYSGAGSLGYKRIQFNHLDFA